MNPDAAISISAGSDQQLRSAIDLARAARRQLTVMRHDLESAGRASRWGLLEAPLALFAGLYQLHQQRRVKRAAALLQPLLEQLDAALADLRGSGGPATAMPAVAAVPGGWQPEPLSAAWGDPVPGERQFTGAAHRVSVVGKRVDRTLHALRAEYAARRSRANG